MKHVLLFKSSDTAAFRRKLAGFMAAANQLNWNVQVVGPITTRAKLRQVLDFWRPDGCAASCGANSNGYPSHDFGVPVVYIDRRLTPTQQNESYVYHDSAATTDVAVRELLSLGLSSYAFVGHARHIHWNTERRERFQRMMALHDNNAATFLWQSPDLSSERQTSKLVSWLLSRPRPVGVFASTDLLARSILNACRRAKLSVPSDVAVIGVDNDEDVCEYVKPTLSSVEPDFHRAGFEAAKILDMLMRKPRHTPIRFAYGPLRLVRRESTRRFTRTDKTVLSALELIRREACDGLTAKHVTELFTCSRRMAEIRFRTIVGHSILEEIRENRLARAKELLLANNNAKQDEIACLCGCNSSAAFSVFFKSETGLSPRDWLQQHSKSKQNQA